MAAAATGRQAPTIVVMPTERTDGRRVPPPWVLGVVAAVAATALVAAAVLALTTSDAPPDDAEIGEAPTASPPAAPAPTPAPETTPPPSPQSILLVVGDPDSPNESEQLLRDHVDERGFEVVVADDDDSDDVAVEEHDLVIVSKTVESTKVGDAFTEASAAVMTWEDNAQAIEQDGTPDEQDTGSGMLSWIDVVNPDDTAWHAPGEDWIVDPDAPAALRAGLSARTPVYTTADEMTYAPAGTLPEEATVVAAFGEDEARVTYYVYDEGDRLADGTAAAGRRIYFGLYDDTFSQLSSAGIDLFDAAVDWGMAG